MRPSTRWGKEALSDGPYCRSGPLADLKLSDESGAVTKYRLHELQLFAQCLECSFESDVMTMASHSFQALYDDLMGIPARRHGYPLSTGPDRKAAGQAANLLWALSDAEPLARLRTKKSTNPVADAQEFLDRSRASGHSDRFWRLLKRLAERSGGDGNDAYQYWAREVVRKDSIE